MDKKQKDVLNKIIPADDLYWDDIDKKYIALSPEEIDSLIYTAIDNGFTEEEEMSNILSWATSVKVGNILLKNFLKGQIAISGFDENNEPYFIKSTNGNI